MMRFPEWKSEWVVFGVIIACIAVSVTAAFVAGMVYTVPAWRFARAYEQLRVGMTHEEVRQLFGPTPDFQCCYKSYRISYYRASDPMAGSFHNVRLPSDATVQSLSDLPDVYSHVQLAFDSEGRLHAYTWIGESLTVESKNGSVQGSHLSRLPESAF